MRKITLTLAALAAALVAAPASAQSPLEGLWTSPKGNVTVRIAPCGARLCGQVVEASAKAQRRAAKQGVPRLVGEPLLNNIEPAGPGKWKGRVYVPRLKSHVGGNITMQGRDRMQVSGCLAGILCKSAVYRRIG
ncbi:hypothetical protein GCM10022280_26980 [Sphingomonas swuensis]|uniref:DUF2147 domain-containing protein n=1 Tax=Sphingomonas swuensis TaxID=977800 RepID=A0ABP7TDF0_9SPHN